jgi:hypothetical protein
MLTKSGFVREFVSHHQLSRDKDGTGMSDAGWLVWVRLTKSVAGDVIGDASAADGVLAD